MASENTEHLSINMHDFLFPIPHFHCGRKLHGSTTFAQSDTVWQ